MFAKFNSPMEEVLLSGALRLSLTGMIKHRRYAKVNIFPIHEWGEGVGLKSGEGVGIQLGEMEEPREKRP